MNKKDILTDLVKVNQTILLVGKSGFGLKEAVKEVAEAAGIKFISAYACDPNAWHCYISKYNTERYPHWAIDAVNNPDNQYLLFLDEIQECLDPEYSKLCKLVEQGIIGNMTLKNVRVCAAYNEYDGKPRKELSEFGFFQKIIIVSLSQTT